MLIPSSVIIAKEGLVALRALMEVGGAFPSVKRRLDGDGGARRAARGQELSVTGLLRVVL